MDTNQTNEGARKLMVHKRQISRAHNKYVTMPEIRLCGKWLKALGFTWGKSVTVIQEENKLTIVVEK